MIHKYNDKIEVLNTLQSIGFRLMENQINELVKLELEPSGLIAEHALPMHVTFYVISGAGSITINQQELEANQGDVIEVSANSQRGWRNTANQLLELLVIKSK